jgi:hypothetical protein
LLAFALNAAVFLLITCAFTTPLHADERQEPGTKTEQTTESQGKDVDTQRGLHAANMAKKLANPLASLISVPFQLNYDQDFGGDESSDRYLMNVQPVVPISLGEDWNLISRTVLPVITQDEVVEGTGRQTGLGDTTESLWFSPKKPTAGGLIWGVGPVILVPTATDALLGGGKWGLGPTVVALIQEGRWTIGGIANHVWSVAGNDNRSDINSTYIQPFLAYNTPTAWTFNMNTESTYDWESEQWSVPVNFMVSKVRHFGEQMVSIQGGVRYWVEGTDSGPEGLGLRFTVTLLFPE